MDLIADVMSNISLSEAKVASRRLEHLSRREGPSGFAEQIRTSRKAVNETLVKAGDGQIPSRSVVENKNELKQRAMLELETVLATKVVEAMMPKDQSRIYGDGTAGETWRGMHIEVMGKALATQGLFSTSRNDSASPANSSENEKPIRIVPFAG